MTRTAGLLSAVAAGAVLTVGATSALFSGSHSSANDTFAAGTVTGTSTTLQSCSASSVAPATSTTVAELTSSSTSIASGSNTVSVTALKQAITVGQTLLIGQATGTVTATASPASLGATSITFNATSSSTGSFPQTFAQGSLVTSLSAQSSSSPVPCQFRYTVGGTASQYIAVDILIVSGDASHPKLWDPSAAGLELVMTDASNNTFTLPVSAVACPGAGQLASSVPAGTLACGLVQNDVLNTSPVSAGTFTLTLDWGLPTAAPSADQGGNTTIFALFHATQSGNNALNCAVTPTRAGMPCAPAGSFSWS